ncbi:hypothetical protein E2562_003211 [Oryza meyeriana var. granulata]|uniref:Uncharacterized protein n=1 Tax=Oryza meyeriana var. granulata TaxID=110450 RepID=A0A6G1EUQ2_9ORYZ|nr:hypothetical protein E2562_003211 [Oryza meyeriana var. granulata]
MKRIFREMLSQVQRKQPPDDYKELALIDSIKEYLRDRRYDSVSDWWLALSTIKPKKGYRGSMPIVGSGTLHVNRAGEAFSSMKRMKKGIWEIRISDMRYLRLAVGPSFLKTGQPSSLYHADTERGCIPMVVTR